MPPSSWTYWWRSLSYAGNLVLLYPLVSDDAPVFCCFHRPFCLMILYSSCCFALKYFAVTFSNSLGWSSKSIMLSLLLFFVFFFLLLNFVVTSVCLKFQFSEIHIHLGDLLRYLPLALCSGLLRCVTSLGRCTEEVLASVGGPLYQLLFSCGDGGKFSPRSYWDAS